MPKLFGEDLEEAYIGAQLGMKGWKEMVRRNTKRNEKYDVSNELNILKERFIPMEPTGVKTLYFYNQHMKRIKGEGNERGFNHQELSTMLIFNYEGTWRDYFNGIMNQMLDGSPEFLSTVIEIDGDELKFIEGVKDLRWDIDHYLPCYGNDWYDKQVNFGAYGLKMGEFNPIERIELCNPNLVEYLFTRRMDKLPEMMVERHSLGLYVPDSGIWPMSTDNMIKSEHDCGRAKRASRGVRNNDNEVKK